MTTRPMLHNTSESAGDGSVSSPRDMSAFTPYKKIREESAPPGDGRSALPGDIIKYNLLLLGLPRSNYFDSEKRDDDDDEEEEEKPKGNKNEGFLMKNILRRDDGERRKKARRERMALDEGAKFADHASRVETLVSNMGKSEHGHRCLYCGKIYSRKYGLKIHVRTHTGYKPLKCKYCSRPFGDPSNLNKHVRLHAQGPTPYKCQFCEKLLVRRRDLERHVKSRHANPT